MRTFMVNVVGINLSAVVKQEQQEHQELEAGGTGDGVGGRGLSLNLKALDLQLDVTMVLDGRYALTLRDSFDVRGLGMAIDGGSRR